MEEVKKWNDFIYYYGQLYHLSQWAEIISSSYGFKPLYLFIEDGREIKSVFPLFHVKIPFLRDELVSVPHIEAGGIIHTEFFPLYLDYIQKHIHARRLKIYQYKEPVGDIVCNTDEVIMVLTVPEKKEEIISKITARNTRRPLRRILEKDFEVAVGNDKSILESFYVLYTEKMREFGTPPHKFAFIKKIADTFGEKCKITLAKHSGNIIGSYLSVIYNQALFNLYAGIPMESLKNGAGLFIEYKTMEMAVENKLKYYIFGRTHKGSGTYYHKSAWGAEPVQIYLYSFTLAPEGYRPYKARTVKQKYGTVSKIWSGLPSFFTDTAGPIIRKWVY